MIAHAPLVLDVAGLSLTAFDVKRLRHPLVGGVILFARNWSDRRQLRALCRHIKKVRADLPIMVDHEGGRVQRFRSDGFTHLPPMRALGEVWHAAARGDAQSSALSATRAASACGFVMGSELRACGVDLTFAPVLDLDYGASGVIGDRAFAREASVVTLLAKSLMHGMLQSGMANCGKHFPGHGFVRADSHSDIPVDRRSLRTILAQDASPYAWLATTLASVMPAHVVYPRVDTLPAGFSRLWLRDILRVRLGFGGAIFSDDLSMAGARTVQGRTLSFTQAAVLALNAGCDLVLLCNQSLDGNSTIDEVLQGLESTRDSGGWAADASSEQRRLSLLPTSKALDWEQVQACPAYQRARALLP
ncbi:MAG: beta-N-acetylhexosaminidase [Burkholderiaceae bacterium]